MSRNGLVLSVLLSSAACSSSTLGPSTSHATGFQGRIVFVDEWTLPKQLLVLNLADGRVTQLTRTPGGKSDPAWSPDGSRVAFVWQPPGATHRQIFVMGA